MTIHHVLAVPTSLAVCMASEGQPCAATAYTSLYRIHALLPLDSSRSWKSNRYAVVVASRTFRTVQHTERRPIPAIFLEYKSRMNNLLGSFQLPNDPSPSTVEIYVEHDHL